MRHNPEATVVVDNERPTTSREALARQTRNGKNQPRPLELPTVKKAVKNPEAKKVKVLALRKERAIILPDIKKMANKVKARALKTGRASSRTVVNKVKALALNTGRASLRTDVNKVKVCDLKTGRASSSTVANKTEAETLRKCKQRNQRVRCSLRYRPTRSHIPENGHCRTCDRALAKMEKKGKK